MASDMEMDRWIDDELEFEPYDREQFRRYRKRHSYDSPVIGSDSKEEQSYPTSFPFIDNIKQEADNFDALESSGAQAQGHDRSPLPFSLKTAKEEADDYLDSAETAYSRFASLLDAALNGFISFADLILQYESVCQEIYESIRNEAIGSVRVTEDWLLRQKGQLIINEAATWSLVWYLFGKSNDDFLQEYSVIPSTSQQEAVDFVFSDHTAQLCLRIIEWLETLASKNNVWYAGSYLHKSAVWHQTQRQLRRKVGNATLVQHLDFDAPTREQAHIIVEDQKQEEALLEDVWFLLRAGKLREACDLCCSAGQAWRAATLCGNCGFEPHPSMEALCRTGKNRTLQSVELDSGLGYQRRLWRWACYYASEKIAGQENCRYETAIFASQCSNLKRILPVCSDWESACWAMVKSWLDVQVDLELSRLQQSKLEHVRNRNAPVDSSDSLGETSGETLQSPNTWPRQVLDQQPRDLQALFQKLHSNDIVHEAVWRGCKDQHRQIQMNLMLGDVSHLLGLLKIWILPPESDNPDMRLHGHPQMIRFGAHLVLVLRHILPENVKGAFQEKLQITGDLILYTYAIFLFSQKHEELVGLYASQLAPYLCVELYVLIMEMRLNESVPVKYKIFRSALEYLPFFPSESPKGCVSEILDRLLMRSRELRPDSQSVRTDDPAEQHHVRNLEKATVVQWLCFTPPSTIDDFELVQTELLARALQQSNILFREFSLLSIWRSMKMPAGAHMLLSYLAEPLKQQNELLLSLDQHTISESIKEFEDWREYYACDALYRNWLSAAIDLEEVPPSDHSLEETSRAFSYAREAFSLSLSLLKRKSSPWLSSTSGMVQETLAGEWIELDAKALLRMPTGDCLKPDATICTALNSAFYLCAGDSSTLRKFSADVSVSPKDEYCVNIILRCLAVEGDGLGECTTEDGGIIASVLADALKGELEKFVEGFALEVFQLDSWYTDNKGSHGAMAQYIILGLCRRCCIPELILRCMQMKVMLANQTGDEFEYQNDLAELIASPDSEICKLFSQKQMQEFLHLEREFCLRNLETQD